MDTIMNRSKLFSGENASVATLSGLDAIAGIWLFLSAFTVSAVGSNFNRNNILCGLVVAALAAFRTFSVTGRRYGWISWVNCVIGVWTAITPWTLGFSANRAGLWNNLITGVVIALFGFWSASVSTTVAGHGSPTPV